MVGNVKIQGQIVGTATFDGAKISAVVTIAPPINATVVFGRSGVSVHNELTGRDAEDAHPIDAITDLPETLQTIVESIPAPLGFTPENAANKKTTLTNSATAYPSTSAVNRLTELKQNDSPEFANTKITTLQSDATGGDIAAVEATWLGATAKSVLSYLQKLLSKVYAINSRVAVLENNVIYTETLANDITAVEYQITGLNLLKNKPYRLLIFCPVNGLTQGLFLLRFNNDSRAIYQRAISLTTGFSIAVGYTATRASFEFVLSDNGDLWGRDSVGYNNGGSYNRTGEINATYGAGWSNVSVISIFRNNMAKIPAGSVITLMRG